MAITTLDDAIAGMQWPRFFTKAVTGTLVAGRPVSSWALGGNPGSGAYGTTLNGVTLSSSTTPVNGQVNFVNPGSGNSYLARLQAATTQAGTLLLCDRIWHNQCSATVTTAQSIVSPTWPARDAFGATNGDGILLGLEISSATSTNAPTITVGYTNQAGIATRSATNVDPTAASAPATTFYRMGLQSGDTGVQSVQSLTLSVSWTGGSINLVAYRPLAALELTAAFVPNAIDAITAGFPRLYNGTVPYFVFIPSTTTATSISGQVLWAQG